MAATMSPSVVASESSIVGCPLVTTKRTVPSEHAGGRLSIQGGRVEAASSERVFDRRAETILALPAKRRDVTRLSFGGNLAVKLRYVLGVPLQFRLRFDRRYNILKTNSVCLRSPTAHAF